MTIVIPIDEVPPVITGVPNPNATGPLTKLPTPGDLIEYTGRGAAAVWGDVWGWVKGESSAAANTLGKLEANVASAVLNVVETYVGTALAAMSGFIDDLGATLDFVSSLTFDAINLVAIEAEDAITYLDRVVYGLLTEVVGIEGHVIPDILQRLLDLGTATETFIHIGVAQAEQWAIDNIYDPLTAEIWRVGVQAEVDIHDGLTQVLDEAKSYADAKTAAIAAAVAAAAAAAAVATEWIDDCGEPMCETIGPKTDLGKLLKGLALAATLADLADLLSLTEPELVQRLTDTIGEFSRFIATIESEFLTGGQTIGATIAGLV